MHRQLQWVVHMAKNIKKWSGYARLVLRRVLTVDYRDIISTIEGCYMPLHVHMVMMVVDVAIIICMFVCCVFPV